MWACPPPPPIGARRFDFAIITENKPQRHSGIITVVKHLPFEVLFTLTAEDNTVSVCVCVCVSVCVCVCVLGHAVFANMFPD